MEPGGGVGIDGILQKGIDGERGEEGKERRDA